MRISPRLLALGTALALCSGVSQAAAIHVFDTSNTVNIPGLTGFATTGAMMNGMRVTATFSGGFSETLSWAATGAASGGVTGTGWSLTQTGDTFVGVDSAVQGRWSFSFAPGVAALNLESLLLEGANGFTVFDVDVYGSDCDYAPAGVDESCSDGSARGSRFRFLGNESATVTYSDALGLAGADPRGDIFHNMLIDFGQGGIRTDFRFDQDTDNDSRRNQVPLPGTLALVGLGLFGLGAFRRRAG